jgi:hypothetical protein
VHRSRAQAGAFASLLALLFVAIVAAAAPRTALAADIDVEVDACALLDDTQIEGLTEWTGFTTNFPNSSPSSSDCFWGSTRAGEPGYVELVVFRESGLDPHYSYGDDCAETPVSDVGEEAAFVECPTEVSLYAYERGAVVSLLVDQPAEPLTADQLAAVVRSILAKLGSVAEVCSLLSEDEIEAVTGMDAQPGVEKETGTVNQFGCGWGTDPYEVQVSVSPSINGPASEGLGSMGYPVEGLGDGAEWWWCDTCADVDTSSSTNLLVVAVGELYVNISFEPMTEEAADNSENVHETHRAWAIELAQLILPQLADVADGTPGPSPSTDDGGELAPTVCLAEEVESAIEGYSGLDPVTDPPADEVADALAALDLTGSAADARDALIRALAADPTDEASLALGANRFRAEVRIDCSPTPVGSSGPAPEPEPGPIESVGGDSGSRTSADRPFAASVPAPTEISTDPVVLLQSAALAALLVFLMPFPSQLFNSTLETHEDEVRRWLRLDRIGAVVGGIGAFWASWPGVILFTVLASLLYGFLDPGFGLDIGSLATFLGMLLGIVLVTAAFAIPSILAHRRHGDRPSLKVVPVSLLIGVGCVLLSRLTDFQPGYLYGLLIGLAFARELSAAEEGRATAIGSLLMLAVAALAWVGLGALPDGDGFALVVVRTSLAALMVAGLEGVVFGLLPMRFLPGEPLYRWNRVLWAGLLLIGAFAFFHILINPASGYLSDTSRTPLLTVVALLVGFSLVSVAFWAWFRFRPEPSTPERPMT